MVVVVGGGDVVGVVFGPDGDLYELELRPRTHQFERVCSRQSVLSWIVSARPPTSILESSSMKHN